MVDFSFEDVGDGSGLFADDYADDVNLFRDTYGAAVAESKVGVNIDA